MDPRIPCRRKRNAHCPRGWWVVCAPTARTAKEAFLSRTMRELCDGVVTTELVRARRTCIAQAEHTKAHVVCGGADGSIGACYTVRDGEGNGEGCVETDRLRCGLSSLPRTRAERVPCCEELGETHVTQTGREVGI